MNIGFVKICFGSFRTEFNLLVIGSLHQSVVFAMHDILVHQELKLVIFIIITIIMQRLMRHVSVIRMTVDKSQARIRIVCSYYQCCCCCCCRVLLCAHWLHPVDGMYWLNACILICHPALCLGRSYTIWTRYCSDGDKTPCSLPFRPFLMAIRHHMIRLLAWGFLFLFCGNHGPEMRHILAKGMEPTDRRTDCSIAYCPSMGRDILTSTRHFT